MIMSQDDKCEYPATVVRIGRGHNHDGKVELSLKVRREGGRPEDDICFEGLVNPSVEQPKEGDKVTVERYDDGYGQPSSVSWAVKFKDFRGKEQATVFEASPVFYGR
jgi:hypothetical protein